MADDEVAKAWEDLKKKKETKKEKEELKEIVEPEEDEGKPIENKTREFKSILPESAVIAVLLFK